MNKLDNLKYGFVLIDNDEDNLKDEFILIDNVIDKNLNMIKLNIIKQNIYIPIIKDTYFKDLNKSYKNNNEIFKQFIR